MTDQKTPCRLSWGLPYANALDTGFVPVMIEGVV